MTTKQIYLIRHGETDFNREGRMQGSGIDKELNQKGLNQAAAFFKKYGQVAFAKVYASGLKRAQQTIEPFKQAGFETEYHPELNEISFGDLEGSLLKPDPESFYNKVMQAWQNGQLDFSAPNGESPNAVVARQQPFINNVLKTNPAQSPILVCMHGRALRVLMCTLLNTPLHQMENYKHHNTGLYIVEYNGQEFVLKTANNTEHLTKDLYSLPPDAFRQAK